MEEGAASSMKFLATRPRWFSKPRRLRPRRPVPGHVDPILSTLERRDLLSAIPVLSGPIASMPSIVESPSTADSAGIDAAPVLSQAQGPNPSFADILWKHLISTPNSSLIDPPPLSLSMTTSTPGDPPIPPSSMDDPTSNPRDGDPGPLDPPRPISHPALSAASILVDGKPTPELAVADDSEGTVDVFGGTKVIFSVGGLNHPEAVKLADLNHDGNPDLIIADSGDNKVLVYPGQAGGGFGPEVTGGLGIPVGKDPVGLTVGDLNGDGQPDLIVANKGSNNVSVLLGRGSGSGWGLTPDATVAAGTAPVRTLIVTPDQGSSTPNLLICDSGSNDIYFYRTTTSGQVEAQPAKIITVGDLPDDFFVGRFSRRQEMDLVTINSGSDNLTYIGGIFSPHPNRQVISTGGSHPIAAVPLNISISGISDLMVANSDGRIALLQAGDNGLQLTGLAAPSGLGNITAIAAGEQGDGALNIYEASSNADSIAILQFNLGDASVFGTAPATTIPITINAENNSLVVEMMTNGGAMLDLVGVLWSAPGQSGASDDRTLSQGQAGAWSLGQSLSNLSETWETGSVAVLSSSGEGQGDEPGPGEASTSWSRFILGLDAAFESFQGGISSVGSSDSPLADDWFSSTRGTSRLVREARDFRQISARPEWFDSTVEQSPGGPSFEDREGVKPSRAFRLVPTFEGNTSSNEPSELATSVFGSAVAVRLLVNASPPRRPRRRPEVRSWTRGRNEANAPWPEVFPPMSPHG